MKPSRVLLVVILAVAAFYIGSFGALGSSAPTIESSGEEIVAWFSANGTAAKTYAWCLAFFSLGLGIFGGQVASLLPRPHAFICFGGVIGWAITAQIQSWFWAGMAFHPQDLAPGAARVLFDIPTFWGPVVNGSSATMAAPFVVLGLGASQLVPRWLGWLSLVFLLEQAIETMTIFGQSGFIAPGGVMNVYIGGLIGFLWIGGLTRWAMMRLDSTPEPKPTG